MNRFHFALAATAASLALVACGDGPDPRPTPTPTTAAQPTTPLGTRAATTQATPAGKTGLKRSDLTNLQSTPSGLQYVDITVGSGESPRMDQSVTVHYVGTLAETGAQFDSSRDRGQPATFPMANVIKGFSEGLSTMKPGGKRILLIPAALGYGPAARPGIPANSDLIFEVELISVR